MDAEHTQAQRFWCAYLCVPVRVSVCVCVIRMDGSGGH